jgi:hypothetical protein
MFLPAICERYPRPTVAFACGSQSTTRTFFPARVRNPAILRQEVVFPVPPLWWEKVMTGILSPEDEFNDHWYNKVCFVFRIALLGFWNNMSGLLFFFYNTPDYCKPYGLNRVWSDVSIE